LHRRVQKKAEKEEKGKNYRLFERTHGSFERSLVLPPGIKSDDIKAAMSKGVLKITLPKPTAAQEQKIKITTQD
jgi:HSP20 family protein